MVVVVVIPGANAEGPVQEEGGAGVGPVTGIAEDVVPSALSRAVCTFELIEL